MKKPQEPKFSPSVSIFNVTAQGPSALVRQEVTINQVRKDTNTIVWGQDDALPLRILQAVDESPTTTSCIGTKEQFLKGSGFTDQKLMDLVINKEGQTLFDLHCQICQYIANLDGFAVNFKYNGAGKITNSYILALESARFREQAPKSKKIEIIRYNPYFGTDQWRLIDIKDYPVFDLGQVQAQIKNGSGLVDSYEGGNKYPGQVYYWGNQRPLYKFYPVPKYWSGSKWIYVDGNIQVFHKENLDNGFFQSTLLNVVGNPNAINEDPRHMTKIKGTDGVERLKATKTNAQVFDLMMQASFSGVKKAGTAMVLWSQTADNAAKIASFPVNAQFDVLSGTFKDAILGITIATEVPAILANLPQPAGLSSQGDFMQTSIELMWSRVASNQRMLENFYNKILIPNLAKSVKGMVKIVNFTPVTSSKIDPTFWDVMSDKEKRKFVEQNVPNSTITSEADSRSLVEILGVGRQGGTVSMLTVLQMYAAKQLTSDGASAIIQGLFGLDKITADKMLVDPAIASSPAPTIPNTPPGTQPGQPTQENLNENLKGINLQQISRIQAIVDRYKLSSSDPTSKKALSYEQAKQFLSSYGFNDDQLNAWLKPNDDIIL